MNRQIYLYWMKTIILNGRYICAFISIFKLIDSNAKSKRIMGRKKMNLVKRSQQYIRLHRLSPPLLNAFLLLNSKPMSNDRMVTSIKIQFFHGEKYLHHLIVLSFNFQFLIRFYLILIFCSRLFLSIAFDDLLSTGAAIDARCVYMS